MDNLLQKVFDMQYTELNKGNISNLLGHYSFLDNIKVRVPNSLFEVQPVWSCLLDDRCPFCNRRLKIGWKRPVVRCDSPHCVADGGFLLKKSKYDEIKGKLKMWEEERNNRTLK